MKEEVQRKCTRCGQVQPIEEFYKLLRGRGGRRSQCASCMREYSEKRKKRVMSAKESKRNYTINKKTMNNYFYLHFGFNDQQYKRSITAEADKYMKEPINLNKLREGK